MGIIKLYSFVSILMPVFQYCTIIRVSPQKVDPIKLSSLIIIIIIKKNS